MKLRKGNYKKVNIKTDPETGGMVLDLPDVDEETLKKRLPKVTVATITYNRAQFVQIMLHNWNNIAYPGDKLEWVIIDDSDDTRYNLKDYLPQDDPRVKYVKLNTWTPIDVKRNMCCEMATGEIIVHMDDDDYYFPDSVLAKVRIIQESYQVEGVMSMPIGSYDILSGDSCTIDVEFENNSVPEATLAYKKSYWERHKFVGTNSRGGGEGIAFMGRNMHKFCNIHFLFNTISTTHGKNFTGQSRVFKPIANNSGIKAGSFREIFPEEFVYILDNIKGLIIGGQPPNPQATHPHPES